MSTLTTRQEQILRAVIVEFVTDAEPVSSDLIANKYELGVKSATVRNELYEMAERGFVEQPHTSSGRVPSDQGYRYFVDRLIVGQPLDAPKKNTLDSITSEEETLQELLQATTKGLSRLTHLLSAATTIRDSSVRVRNCVLTSLSSNRGLLVTILETGYVDHRVFELPAGATVEEIGQVNEMLNQVTVDTPLSHLPALKVVGQCSPNAAAMLQGALSSLATASDQLTRGQVILEGEEFIISQPEFQQSRELLDQLLTSLEDEGAIMRELKIPKSGSTTVTIGTEHTNTEMHALSVLRRAFEVNGEPAGTIAIIGPTRLNYEHAMRLLDYTAAALGETLSKILS